MRYTLTCNYFTIDPSVREDWSFDFFFHVSYFYTSVEDGSFDFVPSVRPYVSLSGRPSVCPLTFRRRSMTLIPFKIFL